MKKIFALIMAMMFIFAVGFAAEGEGECVVSIEIGCFIQATEDAVVSWTWNSPEDYDTDETKTAVFTVKHNCAIASITGSWVSGDNVLGDGGDGTAVTVNESHQGWQTTPGDCGVHYFEVDFSNTFDEDNWWIHDADEFTSDQVVYQITFSS